MTSYMLELLINGKTTRIMLEAMPTSFELKLYRVDQTESLTQIAEKVIL